VAQSFDVAVLVGSLRKNSLTRKVATAMIGLAPPSLRCHFVEIGDLPMYNEDLEESIPAPWARLRREIADAHAVLLVSPEYNRSIPACLKNALDVGSRPSGKNVWSGKPAGIVSVTPFKLGAMAANHAIRQALVFLNMPAMQQPEAYIANAGDMFDEQGAFKSDGTRQFLTKFMTAFERWVATIASGPADDRFDTVVQAREKVASAYSSGDASLLDQMVVHEGAATFFPPTGGFVSGADDVAARYDADVKSFSPGSKTSLEVLQSSASGAERPDLAFWTGFQNFEGKIGGQEVTLRLRITEIFRLSGGEWKLCHRHADPAAAPQPKRT
jgi:NAD(P)H-dependent FMN reductase/ketosteroid isomerase-like protein